MRRIIAICLVATLFMSLATASLATGSLSPFASSIMGQSTFGFPAAIIDAPTSGLPLTAGIYSPGSALELTSSILASTSNPATFMSFIPDASSSGLAMLSGFGGYNNPGINPSQATMISTPDLANLQVPFMGSQLTTGGTQSATNAYTETSNRKTIKVKAGDTFHVQLKARIDQGYIWNMTVTPGLNMTSEQAYAPDNLNLLGGSGITGLFTQDWSIRADQAGAQTITAIYKRPESSSPDDRTFTLTVLVT